MESAGRVSRAAKTTERLTYPVPDEVLAHGFDPVQSQTVQHGAGALHDTQHGDGQDEPQVEQTHDHDDGQDSGLLEGDSDRHRPQHDRQLLVGQGERPETEVGGRVRHTVEAEFDSVCTS